jgi:hypothetical protein
MSRFFINRPIVAMVISIIHSSVCLLRSIRTSFRLKSR